MPNIALKGGFSEKLKKEKKSSKGKRQKDQEVELEEGEIIDDAISKTETDDDLPNSEGVEQCLSEEKRKELMEIAKKLSK